MKSKLLLLVLACLAGGQALAQTDRDTFEISTAPRFFSAREKESDESFESFNLPLSVGYFLTPNLELAPEIWFTVPDDAEFTGINFLANLVWNFNSKTNLVPFVIAGIGYGNGISIMNVANDRDTGILGIDAGVGLRYNFNQHVGLRAEYRFRRYSGSKTYDSAFKRDMGMSIHDLLIGFSIYLPEWK